MSEQLARFLNFCAEFQETLLYKRLSAFFVIEKNNSSKTTHFYEKYLKINCFKTSEAQQKRNSPLFLCYLLRINVKTNIGKTSFVSGGAQKR